MIESVSNYVSTIYGINIGAGKKGECPFCGKKTFSIKPDDKLGKCWHPNCGRVIASHGDGESYYKYRIQSVLGEIYKDWHDHLLGLKTSRVKSRNAYNYLRGGRFIHEKVIEDAMMGAVPPKYSLNKKFKVLVDEIKADQKEEAERRKKQSEFEKMANQAEGKKTARKKTKPPPADDSADKKLLEFIDEAKAKLQKCMNTGWLCFFYTDKAKKVTAIRFRKPYSKDILYFKPFGKKDGLFGHEMFDLNPDHHRVDPLDPIIRVDPLRLDKQLLVMEGEINFLQLQSLCVDWSEWKRYKTPAYANACAIGGVNNADLETIKSISPQPVICYDHDKSGGGYSLVVNAQAKMHLSYFTTPGVGSDLDEFILSFSPDKKKAWEEVNKLIGNRKTVQRDFVEQAADIFYTRQKQDKRDIRRDHEINSRVLEIVKADLRDRGRFYFDGPRTFFFNEITKDLFRLDPEDSQWSLMISKYGINRAEGIFKYVLHGLWTEALEKGGETKVHSLAWYDQRSKSLYLNMFNNKVLKIDSFSVREVDNGADGVLFINPPGVEPWNFVPSAQGGDLFDRYIASRINFEKSIIAPHQARMLFAIWFHSIFFESIMPTKPLLGLIGEKGSGKTLAARSLLRLLFGKDVNVIPMSDDQKDLVASITNFPFVALDNVDTDQKWLNDLLATAATGGTIEKRDYYTTNNLVRYPIRCFISLTSRTPHFRRDDVADRLLVMRLKRFEKHEYQAENEMLDDVMKNRDAIMSEVVYNLRDIMGALDKCSNLKTPGFRMADFGAFAVRVAAMGSPDVVAEVKAALALMEKEQHVFAEEGDPDLTLVKRWIQHNPGASITNSELCAELEDMTKNNRKAFTYAGNPIGFGRRMSSMRDALIAEGYRVEEEAKKTNNKTWYRYFPPIS